MEEYQTLAEAREAHALHGGVLLDWGSVGDHCYVVVDFATARETREGQSPDWWRRLQAADWDETVVDD